VAVQGTSNNGAPVDAPDTFVTTLLVTLANGACRADGVYTFTLGLACNPAFNSTQCPPITTSANSGASSATIAVTVTGQDLCAQLQQQVALTGSLVSYQDTARTTPLQSFFQNDIAYFRSTVTSPLVSIVSNSLTAVSVINGQTPVSLVTASTVTAQGTAAAYTTDNTAAGIADFHFQLVNSVLPVNVDQFKTFDVTVTVLAQYSIGRKRQLTFLVPRSAVNSGSTSATTTVAVANLGRQSATTGSSGAGAGGSNGGGNGGGAVSAATGGATPAAWLAVMGAVASTVVGLVLM
jgi:hypothetical protein